MMNDDHVLSQVPPGVSENSIKQYWIYMQNHNLNNVSGIVQGDVLLIGKEMQQFAVKEGGFNTAAVGPYLATAFLILNFSDFDIKKILKSKNLNQLGSNISKHVDILAEEIVDDEVKSILSGVLKLTK